MANNAANVSVGKPKIGGAIYVAPKGTTLPGDATTTLASSFKHLGYIADAGLTNDNSKTSNDIKAWGGDIVMSTTSEVKDEWTMTLIEVLNLDVLKTVYGASNVTGTSIATGIEIGVNSSEADEHVWVIEMVLTGSVAKRVVIPSGKITNLDTINYNDTDAIGYAITVTAFPGTDGDTHKEYIEG